MSVRLGGWLRRALAVPIVAVGLLSVVTLFQSEANRRVSALASTPRRSEPAVPKGRHEGQAHQARSREQLPPIRIGWTAWADAEFVSKLAKRVLEDRMGYDVELVMADIGIQYQGVSTGDLDVMLMAWLPLTHRNYWERVSDSVVNLGPVYTRARLGWVVPSYVPKGELASIEDLRKPAVQRRLSGRVYGIDPGSGLMQASERAMRSYQLEGLRLVASSGAAMTAALARAIRQHEWIVATAWSPHWMFARWQLRYLRDPRGALGGRERVHVLTRLGFYQEYPAEVTEMLTRMYLPLAELEEALLRATKSSAGAAVGWYLRAHAARVAYWVTGELE